MKVNKTELSELLKMHPKSVSRLTLEQLEKKLLNECWQLISIDKEGRSIIYTLEYHEQDFNINNFVENEFNVKEGKKFMCHTSLRFKSIEDDIPITRKEIGDKVGVSEVTINNYDKKLEEKEIIQKDGFYYVCRNNKTDEYCLVDEEAYNNFWYVNRLIDRDLQRIYDQFMKGEITRKDCEFLTQQKRDELGGDLYYYKVSKYLIDKNNDLYKLISKNL